MSSFRQRELKDMDDRQNDVYSAHFVPKKYAKNSAEYGRPPPGSLTEMRANKAAQSILKEMYQLCQVIEEYGHRRANSPDKASITFGDLFKIYQFISDKLVGILLRARKHNMLHFEGEMLFQRRDDHKVVRLLLDHEQILLGLAQFSGCFS